MNEDKFQIYFEQLVLWNKRQNLTTVIERDQVEKRHFKDSILPKDIIPTNATLLDIGSGAGFPGIPLKIVRPDLKVTLIDSLGKRVEFLKEVIRLLELKEICAIHTRIEDFKERDGYDVVVARAVAPLKTLCEYALPFVKIGGIFIAYKGPSIEEELAEASRVIEVCGGGNTQVKSIYLDEETKRNFVVIEKVAPCPKKYPRGGNKPRTSPI